MKAKTHYTNSELTRFAIEDQLRDALHAQKLIASGELTEGAIAIERKYAEDCLRRANAMAGRELSPREIDAILAL